MASPRVDRAGSAVVAGELADGLSNGQFRVVAGLLQHDADPLAGLAAGDANVVLLVKPQFEAGRDGVGPGGVVREPELWEAAIRGVAEAAQAAGLRPLEVMASPVRGPAGNVEFLMHAVKASVDTGDDPSPGAELDVGAAVAAGLEIAGRA